MKFLKHLFYIRQPMIVFSFVNRPVFMPALQLSDALKIDSDNPRKNEKITDFIFWSYEFKF